VEQQIVIFRFRLPQNELVEKIPSNAPTKNKANEYACHA